MAWKPKASKGPVLGSLNKSGNWSGRTLTGELLTPAKPAMSKGSMTPFHSPGLPKGSYGESGLSRMVPSGSPGGPARAPLVSLPNGGWASPNSKLGRLAKMMGRLAWPLRLLDLLEGLNEGNPWAVTQPERLEGYDFGEDWIKCCSNAPCPTRIHTRIALDSPHASPSGSCNSTMTLCNANCFGTNWGLPTIPYGADIPATAGGAMFFRTNATSGVGLGIGPGYEGWSLKHDKPKRVVPFQTYRAPVVQQLPLAIPSPAEKTRTYGGRGSRIPPRTRTGPPPKGWKEEKWVLKDPKIADVYGKLTEAKDFLDCAEKAIKKGRDPHRRTPKRRPGLLNQMQHVIQNSGKIDPWELTKCLMLNEAQDRSMAWANKRANAGLKATGLWPFATGVGRGGFSQRMR